MKLIDATNEAKQLRDRLNELFENRDRYTWRETLESFKVVMIRMSEMRSRIANSTAAFALGKICSAQIKMLVKTLVR